MIISLKMWIKKLRFFDTPLTSFENTQMYVKSGNEKNRWEVSESKNIWWIVKQKNDYAIKLVDVLCKEKEIIIYEREESESKLLKAFMKVLWWALLLMVNIVA